MHRPEAIRWAIMSVDPRHHDQRLVDFATAFLELEGRTMILTSGEGDRKGRTLEFLEKQEGIADHIMNFEKFMGRPIPPPGYAGTLKHGEWLASLVLHSIRVSHGEEGIFEAACVVPHPVEEGPDRHAASLLQISMEIGAILPVHDPRDFAAAARALRAGRWSSEWHELREKTRLFLERYYRIFPELAVA